MHLRKSLALALLCLLLSGMTVAAAQSDAEARRIEALYEQLNDIWFGMKNHEPLPIKGREWFYDMVMRNAVSDNLADHTEIDTDDEAAKLAKIHKDAGFNTVIISGRHFRYADYLRGGDLTQSLYDLGDYLGRITAAMHAEGLKVVEHHDPTLIYSGTADFLQGRSHWVQRDIRDGSMGRMFCINNPEYVRHYIGWIANLQQKAHPDAYMIDEVSFMPNGLFCGCDICRTKFKADTGLDMPVDADSKVFGNSSDPLWQVWTLWQKKSVNDFFAAVKAAVQLIDPATELIAYTSNLGDGYLYDIIAQARVQYSTGVEVMSIAPGILHRCVIADLMFRTGFADSFGHPSWALIYAGPADSTEFSYALCKLTRNAHWVSQGTSEDPDYNPGSAITKYAKWPDAMKNSEAVSYSDVGLLFSNRSKLTHNPGGAKHWYAMVGWSIALMEAQTQYQVLMEDTLSADQISRHALVIVANAYSLSPATVKLLKDYVHAGGRVILSGEAALYDMFRNPMKEYAFADEIPIGYDGFAEAPWSFTDRQGRRVTVPSEPIDPHHRLGTEGRRALIFEVADSGRVKVRTSFEWGVGRKSPLLMEASSGKGKWYVVAAYPGLLNTEAEVPHHWGIYEYFVTADPLVQEFMQDLIAEAVVGRQRVVVENAPPGLRAFAHKSRVGNDRLWVQLLNATGFPRPKKGDKISKDIVCPPIEREITVLLPRMKATSAVLQAPEKAPIPCRIERKGDGSRITIPPGSIDIYRQLTITGEIRE